MRRAPARCRRCPEIRSGVLSTAMGMRLSTSSPASLRSTSMTQVERGAVAQFFERARHRLGLAAAEHEVDRRARLDGAAADQPVDGVGIGGADFGAAQRARQAFAAADARGSFDARSFGGFGEFLDHARRRRVAAGCGTERQRADGIGCGVFDLAGGIGCARRHRQRRDAPAAAHRQRAQQGDGGGAEPPVARADAVAEIDAQIDVAQAAEIEAADIDAHLVDAEAAQSGGPAITGIARELGRGTARRRGGHCVKLSHPRLVQQPCLRRFPPDWRRNLSKRSGPSQPPGHRTGPDCDEASVFIWSLESRVGVCKLLDVDSALYWMRCHDAASSGFRPATARASPVRQGT